MCFFDVVWFHTVGSASNRVISRSKVWILANSLGSGSFPERRPRAAGIAVEVEHHS